MEQILTVLGLLRPVWELLKPGDLDVVVEATMMEIHEDAVVAGFDGLDDLRDALKSWANEQLPELVGRLKNGERLTAEDIDASLHAAVLDDFPDCHGQEAAQAFVSALRTRLYASPDAALILGNQIDTHRTETSDGFDALTSVVNAGFEGFQRSISSLTTSEADASDGGPPAADLNRVRIETRLDEARQLLIEGKPRTALARLDRIESSEVGHLWTRAQFRVSLNSAVALMQMGEWESAEERLSRAERLFPEDPVLRANRIQLRLGMGDTQSAVECAQAEIDRGLLPEVRTAVMHALTACGRAAEAVQLVTDIDAADADELLALSSAQLSLDDSAQAARSADRAAALRPGDPTILHAYGLALLVEARRFSSSTAVSGGDPTATVTAARERLREAETAASKGELTELLIDVRTNLAAAELALDNPEEAVRLCGLTLELRPDDTTARLNRGVARFRLGEHELAASDLVAALPEHAGMAVIPLAASLLALDRDSEALSVIQDVWSEDIDEDLRVDIAGVAVQATDPGEHGEFLDTTVEYLSGRAVESPAACVALARRASAIGDSSETKRLLGLVDFEEALRAGSSPLIVLDAAVIYYRQQDYADASAIAGLLKDDPHLPKAAELHVMSLYRAGRLAEAYEAARGYRLTWGVHPTVAQVEAAMLRQLGDMTSAAELYEELYKSDGDLGWGLNAAAARISAGDEDAAALLMRVIDAQSTDLSPEGQMQAAGILLHLGMPGELEAAYSAARRAPNSPEIQSAYTGIFLQRSRGDDSRFDASEVQPGTAVLISIDGKKSWRLMLDDNERNAQSLDLKPDTELGSALLGHKVGDSVVLGRGEDVLVVRVEEIQSKYVRLFQEAFAEFGTRFPTDRSIRAIKVSENDLTELHAELGRHHQAMVQAMTLVNENGVPASAFSRLTGIGIFESTHALLSDSKVRSRVSDGSLLPNQEIQTSDTLVLDVSALVTLQAIGLLPVLEQSAVTCVVTTQVMDELRAAEHRLSDRMHSVTLAGDGQRIHLTSYEENQELSSVVEIVAEILRFVDAECSTGTSTSLLSYSEEGNTLRAMLGGTGLSTALYSVDLGAIAVSDEAGMRILAKVELGARSADTLGIIRMLVAEKTLTEEDARTATAQFIELGYAALPLTAEEILCLVKERHLNPDAATVTIVSGALAKAILAPQEIAVLGADILTVVCFDEPLGLGRQNLVDAVLEGLHKRGDSAVGTCLGLVKRRLLLAPLQWQRLVDYSKAWYAARGLEPPRVL